MTKPGQFVSNGCGTYAFACALCGWQSPAYCRTKARSPFENAHHSGCRNSLVRGWLCPGCAAFYEAIGGFDLPEEQLPF